MPSILRCMGQPRRQTVNWPRVSAVPRLRTPERVNKETRATMMLVFHTLGRANLQLPARCSCLSEASQQSEPPHKTSPLIVVVSRLQPQAEQERGQRPRNQSGPPPQGVRRQDREITANFSPAFPLGFQRTQPPRPPISVTSCSGENK